MLRHQPELPEPESSEVTSNPQAAEDGDAGRAQYQEEVNPQPDVVRDIHQTSGDEAQRGHSHVSGGAAPAVVPHECPVGSSWWTRPEKRIRREGRCC